MFRTTLCGSEAAEEPTDQHCELFGSLQQLLTPLPQLLDGVAGLLTLGPQALELDPDPDVGVLVELALPHPEDGPIAGR